MKIRIALSATAVALCLIGYWLVAPTREQLPTTESVLNTVAWGLMSVSVKECQHRRPLRDFRPMFDDAAFDTLVDEWRHPLMVQCGARRLEVRSAGRDGVYDTDDDLVVTREMN